MSRVRARVLLAGLFADLGLSPEQVADRFRFITGWAPMFRERAEAVEEEEAQPR